MEADEEKAARLQAELKINLTLCKILVQRGIDSFDLARHYFRPQLEDLHDPWLMKDMDKAVDRIFQGFRNEEKILIFGDYDVDGTSSVALVYQFLRKIYHPRCDQQTKECPGHGNRPRHLNRAR